MHITIKSCVCFPIWGHCGGSSQCSSSIKQASQSGVSLEISLLVSSHVQAYSRHLPLSLGIATPPFYLPTADIGWEMRRLKLPSLLCNTVSAFMWDVWLREVNECLEQLCCGWYEGNYSPPCLPFCLCVVVYLIHSVFWLYIYIAM